MVYNASLDSVCSLFTGREIRQDWEAELVARKPEFDDLWRSLGPKWIAAAEVIAGKAFPNEEITAAAQALPDDCYAKAWALVNASEMAYLRYVAEIAR